MNGKRFRLTLTYFAALSAIVVLMFDFFMPSAASVSSAIKYAGLIACVVIAVAGEDGTLRAALLLTAMCDYLLLFTDVYVPGVLAFACAQTLHAMRHAQMAALSRVKFVLPAAILALVAAVIVWALSGDTLNAVAALYAVMLLCATGLAIAAYLRKKTPDRTSLYAAGGMLLFVLCDLSVAAFNLGFYRAGNLMWLFYLPSQLLLAWSARTPEPEPPREKPPGWHK
jgi:hypothetical protein